MRPLRDLPRCQQGATIVEFALLAPVFLMMIFGIIETGRMLWMQQTLDEVAFSTARCMSVGTACQTTATQRSHAVERAAGYGILVPATGVTTAADTVCNGYANSSTVTIEAGFNSPLSGLIPGLPPTLQAHSCYPKLSE